MVDALKKIGAPVLVIIGIVIVAVAVAFYILWRKLQSHELESKLSEKKVQEMQVKQAEINTTIDRKNDEIREQTKVIGELKERITRIESQVTELKKALKKRVGIRQDSRQNRANNSCDDGSCIMPTGTGRQQTQVRNDIIDDLSD